MDQTHPFGLLQKLSILFKVISFLVFVLMLIGVVGMLVANRHQATPIPMQVILNTAFSGILAFLMLFTAGEVIRLLLAIEAQTRKNSI